MMDMMNMSGGMEFSPLYAQAKEILAAGMLAELAEDAKEAMGEGEDQGGEDTCPHCGAPMGGPMGNPMAKKMLLPMDGMGAEGQGGPMLPPQLAMRMPAPAMPPAPVAGRGAMTPLSNLGM